MGICVICREDINEECLLKCNHSFHKNCLMDWLLVCFSCPVCRTNPEFSKKDDGVDFEILKVKRNIKDDNKREYTQLRIEIEDVDRQLEILERQLIRTRRQFILMGQRFEELDASIREFLN